MALSLNFISQPRYFLLQLAVFGFTNWTELRFLDAMADLSSNFSMKIFNSMTKPIRVIHKWT